MTLTADVLDRLLIARSVLKGLIAELELALGVEGALPVTMPLLEALDAAERLRGGG